MSVDVCNMELYRLYKSTWIFNHDPHKERKLQNNRVLRLLKRGGVMVRNVYDFDCGEETSFWYVIKDSFGGMDELTSKMRNQVKKCFKTMRVERISSDFLLVNGYNVFVEAMDNYRVKAKPPTLADFEHRILTSDENEYWGVFDIETGKLVAFSMNAVTDECCEYRTMKAIPEYQRLYAYYGLIYEMNRHYLSERKLKYVNDGARTITNHSNIQSFLIEKFNFRKAYCHIKITYKWWLDMAIKILYPLRRLMPVREVRALLNMEAMVRGDI